MVSTVLLAIGLQKQIWYGGTASEFCRFLGRRETDNLAVDIGHVAVVPRIVFDRTLPNALPPLPSDIFTVSSKYAIRLVKGAMFPPTMFDISNAEERFPWSVTHSSRKASVKKSGPPFQDFFSVTELLELGAPGLSPPNPTFGQPLFYLCARDLPKAQYCAIAAEMIDHDLLTVNGVQSLVPRVPTLRSKILKTMEEYVGASDSRYDEMRRLDIAVLKELPIGTWQKLLTLKEGMITIPLGGTSATKAYDRVFRKKLRSDEKNEDQWIQAYFSPGRTLTFDLLISPNFRISHGIVSVTGGKSMYTIY